MYLADTSAWIDFTRPKPGPIGLRLKKEIQAGVPVYITGMVFQEVLQGARDETFLRRHEDWLLTQPFVHPPDPVAMHAAAARLYARCRWQGVTIRSANDCFIAQMAIEHRLRLLHDDRDFERIASIEPRLKLA